MAGGNKGISDQPIRLKICSPNVLCALAVLALSSNLAMSNDTALAEALVR